MSNHLSPAAASEHSSYATSSSNTGASPSLSHRSLATTVSSSSPSPSAKTGQDMDAPDVERPKPIICRWDNCGRVYYDPEVVYKHLCDDHVGRKSTNNLCLTCRWEGCDVSCAKRDHITSHLRVHTPLKPHSCDICNKTFKRPQDLKKHERIHTEQHQQQRQHKAAQNAAAKTYGSMASDPSAFGTYHLGAGGMPNSYTYGGFAPHATMYHHAPEVAYPTSAYPTLPSQPMREHTPGYAQSNASLSPLSSRLDTPQGSSPAAHAGRPTARDSVSYLNFTSGPDARSKATSDPNSYMFLAHGASTNHVAGTKRHHEQVGEFFGDVRRKRIAPTYDANMADRLNQTFGGGIDDASLQALLSSFEAPATSTGLSHSHSQPSSTQHTPETLLPMAGQQPSKLALPDSMRSTDVAQLNAWLLQLGANAARDPSMPHVSAQGGMAAGNASHEFDINALSQYGLTSIPGFDESYLTSSGHDTSSFSFQAQAGGAAQMHRPIAQLPHRQQGTHQNGSGFYGSNYASGYDASPGTSSHGGPPYSQTASFDSMRVSRGSAIVPQLAPMDMGGHSFRKVEALTRAAPGPTTTAEQLDRSSEPSQKHTTVEDDNDDEMHDAEVASPGSTFDARYRSVSPAASSDAGAPGIDEGADRYGSASPSLGIYPKLNSGESLRRLPSLRSSSSSPSSSSPRRGLSISSILSSDSAESDSSPRRLPPIRQDSASSESSTSLYPSLAEQISSIKGLGRPASRSTDSPVPETVRQQHVRLIRQLLIAINFPSQARPAEQEERITLAPILTRIPESSKLEADEGEKTPSQRQRDSASPFESESDASSDATPPGRARLPTISQLLNDVNVDVDALRRPRAMEEREMECDV